MPVLLSISVLALIALLWAALSAAQYVRRARRRKRRSLGTEASASGLHLAVPVAAQKLSFEEVTPYVEAVVSRPSPLSARPALEAPVAPRVVIDVPEPAYVATPAYIPRLTYEKFSPFVSASRAEPAEPLPALSEEGALPAPEAPQRRRTFLSSLFSAARRRSEEESGLHGEATPQLTEAAPVPELKLEPIPAAHFEPAPPVLQVETSVPVAMEPPALLGSEVAAPVAAEAPAPLKPTRTLSGRHAVASFPGKMERQDWAYFNKDLGDLTDPYQGPRSRLKTAPGDLRR